MSISQETLRLFIPFDNMKEEYLNRVQSQVKLKCFPKGTLVFKRGKLLRESFYLINGKIDLIDSAFAVNSLRAGSEKCRFPLCDTSPTHVSAIARSDVELLSVERNFLDLVLAWSQSSDFSVTGLKDQQVEVDDAEESDWMSCLLRSALFTQIPPANIQQLFTHFESFEVEAGEEIVREGEQGDFFYAIELGAVEVKTKAGKSQAILNAGDYFGEEALIGETTRNATVTMCKKGVLMRLAKVHFKALLQEPVLRYVSYEQMQEYNTAEQTSQVVDVRLPVEYRHRHVAEARNLPLSTLRHRFDELDQDALYVVTDDAGSRSEVATHLLCQAGFNACILQSANLCYDRDAAV